MRVTRALLVYCSLIAGAATAADSDTLAAQSVSKLSPIVVRDLHYGDVLFHFYQGEDFDALTRLNAYRQWHLTPNHDAEGELLLGGLYLSLGMHNEAGERFERLLTRNLPEDVRNRAWFYLGKIWYARGYLERAERAIRSIDGVLTPELEAERLHLLANTLMRQERFDEAIALLNGWRARDGQQDWLAYAEFNLGVALIRKGLVSEADPILTRVGQLESGRRELRSLRDRANLALGYAYIQAEQAEKARLPLERVRLNGPYSTKALLGVGWADAAAGDFEGALTPWLELRDRNLLDAAVQESYLAIPYAFRKLDANAQAAESYELALRSFDEESARIDQSISTIKREQLLDQFVAKDDQQQYGWFWSLRQVPDAPESRYLYALLASHDFQEGLKNYRDLGFLSSTLSRWDDSIGAFDDMIDTRERAYAERLPRADALLASGAVESLRERRDRISNELTRIEQSKDVAALGTQEQRDQWQRIARVEAALATLPADEENDELREKARLVKGALYWQLDEAFKARAWNQRRTLRDLDQALREADNRWIRVEKARTSAPTNTGEFAARLQALKERLDGLTVRLVDMQAKQNDLLERLAIRQLEQQKARLAAYSVQARFELAAIYDGIASSAPAREPETEPQPAPEPGPVPESDDPVSRGEGPVQDAPAPPSDPGSRS
ncbi:MAG TPA: hypothetical protein P5528_15265 [Steroidobacteraceae bacterium]|mgnify:CR=1 FL=1|nr:hypothetical protein [Steroidobacteraceae bacterium]HRX90798.1 hypothetical protein [Steroidobacteraceae bacterium]